MIVSRSPLRVSLFGGGTDFPHWFDKNGCTIVSATIDKYVYAIVNQRFDDRVRMAYTETELVASASELKHELARKSLEWFGISNGVEIVTVADIPSSGSGLGSSAAVTVAILKALDGYKGRAIDNQSLAWKAVEIEGLGYQDQFATAVGGLRTYRFGINGVGIGRRIESGLDSRLMLFYTGLGRSSKPILREKAKAKNKRVLSGIQSIAESAVSVVEHGGDIGELLHESWLLKRGMVSGVTNDEIDLMYSKAREAGATGGKICGAGGGGFLLVHADVDCQDDVREALKDYQELPFSFSKDGAEIVFI